MQQCMLKNLVNSGKALTGNAEGNPEPSPIRKSTKIEVYCAVCGKSKMISQYEYNKNQTGNFYCSKECLKVGHSRTFSGSNNPSFGKHLTKAQHEAISGKNHWNYGNRYAAQQMAICKNCKKLFFYNPNKEAKEKFKIRLFCSRACRYEFDKGMRIIKKCAWCGKPVEKVAYYKDQDRFFCGYHCRSKYFGNQQPKGKQAYWFGKRCTETPNWRGGLSFEPYGIDFNNDLKEAIRKRDDYVCQLCDAKENGYKLHVHHIDYGKQNNNEWNLIALCRSCHVKTNGNRDYWIKYFQEFQNNRKGATTIPEGSTPQADGGGSARHPIEQGMMI